VALNPPWRIPGRRDAHRWLEDPPVADELALNAVKGVLPAEPESCGGNRIPGRRDAHRWLEDPPVADELALSVVKGVLPAEPWLA